MKNPFFLLSVLLTTALLVGCRTISLNSTPQTVIPSDQIITENRAVSGFSGLKMSTVGTLTLTQGEQEALTIRGSDNLVPLVKTRVQNGILVIEMENVNLQSLEKDEFLTFDITVKDLKSLTISGLGTVEMPALKTKSLDLVMSGAGAIKIDQLTADSVSVNVSGLGGITLVGTTSHLGVKISGAGEVNAADLECKTAEAKLSGIGTATLWVTEALTGEISGAGSVRYYGEPQAKTSSSSVGRFEDLGSK